MSGALTGKVAIISGSGRGIGRAIAEKLADAGAAIVVNDLDEDVANETVAAIFDAGGQAVACVGDVTAEGFADRFVGTATGTYGRLDIIVNNAGFAWDAILQRTSDEQWQAMLDVHLTAPFRILRAAQPAIAAAAKAEVAAGQPMGRRSVINISSIAALGGNIGQSGYSAAKAGIIGLTHTLAKEWGRYNVTVNCVAFGIIGTRMTMPEDGVSSVDVGGRAIRVGMGADLKAGIASAISLGRSGSPAEAAGAIYLLCLDEASYITGEVLACTGGYTL